MVLTCPSCVQVIKRSSIKKQEKRSKVKVSGAVLSVSLQLLTPACMAVHQGTYCLVHCNICHSQSGPVALQTFLKVVNYQHLMPTRYTLDVDLKSLVTADVVDNSTKRIEVRKVRSPSPFLQACIFSVEMDRISAVMEIQHQRRPDIKMNKCSAAMAS